MSRQSSIDEYGGSLVVGRIGNPSYIARHSKLDDPPGPTALPFLFRDLEQTADGHLSKALTTLTGAHPVPTEDRGQVRKVAEAWLRWARENGYRW